MKLYIGGVRGGNTVADPAFARYGGDTTSFLIEGNGGERVIIDAGSGIRSVYARLRDQNPDFRSVLLLFSHFHLDHLCGLPSFPPLYNAEWSIEVASRVFEDLTAEDVLSSFVNPPIWPLPLEELRSTKFFRILDAESMEKPSEYGGLTIRWCPLHHPGGSTAFRIDDPASGASLVIATDIEWSESSDEEKAALKALCRDPRGADMLVFDGKCAPDAYEPYRGWGHSTWQEGIDLAQACDVGRLLIAHHAADMDDAAGDLRDAQIRAVWSAAAMARQGDLIEIG